MWPGDPVFFVVIEGKKAVTLLALVTRQLKAGQQSNSMWIGYSGEQAVHVFNMWSKCSCEGIVTGLIFSLHFVLIQLLLLIVSLRFIFSHCCNYTCAFLSSIFCFFLSDREVAMCVLALVAFFKTKCCILEVERMYSCCEMDNIILGLDC